MREGCVPNPSGPGAAAAAGFPELRCVVKVEGAEDVELWHPYKVSERDRLCAEMTQREKRQTRDE